MLGGFTRLTMPVVLMLIEMTGDASYLLPIMYVACVSKFLADFLENPLYPQHMAIEQIPVLGDKLPPTISGLTASDIMSTTYGSIYEFAMLSDVLDTLDKSKHSMMPVVDTENRLLGMVPRTSIVHALQNAPLFANVASAAKASRDAQNEALGQPVSPVEALSPNSSAASPSHRRTASRQVVGNVSELLSDWSDTTDYAATLTKFDDRLLQYVLDLGPHTDQGSLTAHAETSVKRVAALFRRCGISHLCVTSIDNRLLGVITRRHLLGTPALVEAVHGHEASAQAAAHHAVALSPSAQAELDDGPIMSPNVRSPRNNAESDSDASEPASPAAQRSVKANKQLQPSRGSLSGTSPLAAGAPRSFSIRPRTSSIDSASSVASQDSVSIRVNGKARPRLTRQKTALQRIAAHTNALR